MLRTGSGLFVYLFLIYLQKGSTGKGGRNSAASGSNQNKAGHLSDFLNTVLHKARHEKLVQVSPEWPGTGE